MKIQVRTEKGSKVRSKNLIPGVLYGKGIESTSISVNALEFTKMYYLKGTSKTFEVTLEGKTHIVYIKDIQSFPCAGNTACHFDLVKISKDANMNSKVRVSYNNHSLVEKLGLMLNTVTEYIEIEYAVGKGISAIDLDVSALVDGDILLVSDLTVPKGVKILSNPEDVVVSVSKRKEDYLDTLDEEEEEVEVEYTKQKEE
ncbi:MAG: 50S ribosomal protein L25 [Candidatus Izemoplasma sp.]